MKRHFDNVHGTGESALTSIMVTTNVLIAGKSVVIAGYGFCGRGLARKLHGLGAKVIVTEVDPRRALEAHMDGFQVMSMDNAATLGDLFITATGDVGVITGRHFPLMKDGVILANAGHFNVEIDVNWLESHSDEKISREGIDSYRIGRKNSPPSRRREAREPRYPKGNGPPDRSDGHEFRTPGTLCPLYGRRGQGSETRCIRCTCLDR